MQCFFCSVLCLLSFYSQSQGRLERKEMKAVSLENNPAGESANRLIIDSLVVENCRVYVGSAKDDRSLSSK